MIPLLYRHLRRLGQTPQSDDACGGPVELAMNDDEPITTSWLVYTLDFVSGGIQLVLHLTAHPVTENSQSRYIITVFITLQAPQQLNLTLKNMTAVQSRELRRGL